MHEPLCISQVAERTEICIMFFRDKKKLVQIGKISSPTKKRKTSEVGDVFLLYCRARIYKSP